MTQTAASAAAPDDHHSATAKCVESDAALDLAEAQFRAHMTGRHLGDEARASISQLLSGALRDLTSLETAAEPGSDEALRASEGLQRFYLLLGDIAEAGLLPSR